MPSNKPSRPGLPTLYLSPAQPSARLRIISTRIPNSSASCGIRARRAWPKWSATSSLRGGRCIFLRQSEVLGLGHEVLCAEPAIGREPFVVLLADDLMRGNLPTRQLVEAYERDPGTILSVMEVPPEEAQNYGIVEPSGDGGVAGLVEKPVPGTEPSRLASIGRYVLEAEIFDILRTQPPGQGGEIQLADAINTRAKQVKIRAVPLTCERYDCGSKLGYLEAIVNFALAHPNYAEPFKTIISEKLTANRD